MYLDPTVYRDLVSTVLKFEAQVSIVQKSFILYDSLIEFTIKIPLLNSQDTVKGVVGFLYYFFLYLAC